MLKQSNIYPKYIQRERPEKTYLWERNVVSCLIIVVVSLWHLESIVIMPRSELNAIEDTNELSKANGTDVVSMVMHG